MAVAHNYFFALRPDAWAVDRIGRIARRVRRAGGTWKPMAAHRLHVSVKSVGLDGEPMDDWARRTVDAVVGLRFPAFTLEFNRLAAFGGDALVLRGDEGVIGVDLLRDALHDALVAARLSPRRRPPFEAHVTLMRGPCVEREIPVPPIAWRVREFVLIHSFVGQTRYEIAACFPLTG